MKTRYFFLTGLTTAIVMTLTSCISSLDKRTLFDADYVTENRPLKDFEEIEINGSPTVYYEQADSFSVKVKGPDKHVEYILTEKAGKSLVIRNKGKIGMFNILMTDDDELAVYVTSPDLVSVTLNGSGDFISKSQIDTDDMKIALRGSGDISIKDLVCDHCRVELIGSGDIDLDQVDTRIAIASLIGSGDIDLKLRNTEETRLSLKGSGDISAKFSEGCKSVECELHGSGDINLEGNVSHFSKQKSGSGDVNVGKLTVK